MGFNRLLHLFVMLCLTYVLGWSVEQQHCVSQFAKKMHSWHS